MDSTPPQHDDTLTAAGGGAARGPLRTHHLANGATLGRYVVLRKLGEGGMGVVYAGYDPELDRKVALKLLRPDTRGDHDAAARTRILREAQALASLAHPNVVGIYDVGTHDDRVWLAMELIEGTTLGAWARAEPRSERAIIDVALAIGRGIAAAHAAGILHRDLKPDNIMIAADGRVRVMDFGLARRGELQHRATLERIEARPEVQALAMHVTIAGAIVGTPAYMAPEQLGGAAIDEAADQFSLCVTLWELLHGERPFAADSLPELAANMLDGKIRRPPVTTSGWLRRTLARGLAADPSARWPSIDALLVELARGRSRARARRIAITAVVLGIGAAGVAAAAELRERALVTACNDEGARVDATWNDDARREVHGALVSTGIAHAQVSAEKATAWFDRHAAAWRAAQIELCLDDRVHRVVAEDVRARAQWCLDDRLAELHSSVELLGRSDAAVAARAVEAASRLSQVEPCRRRERLARLPLPPESAREQIAAIREMAARADALEHAGQPRPAMALASDALARAEQAGWTPAIAAARLRVGRLLDRTGEYADAETTLEASYFEAARADAPEVVAGAAIELLWVVGVRARRADDARRWAKHAEIGLLDLDADDDVQMAIYLSYLGQVHLLESELDAAASSFERALAIRQAFGDDHPDVADALGLLAEVKRASGAYEEALALYDRALAIERAALGDDHPALASTSTGLSRIHQELGHADEAESILLHVMALEERALGPDHPDLAVTCHNLAALRRSAGRHAEAETLERRALSIRERALPAHHPDLGDSLSHVGTSRAAQGDFAGAVPLFERALEISERALGSDHADLRPSLNNLAIAYQETGKPGEAAALHRRVLAITEKELGPEHPDAAYSWFGLGTVQHAAGELDAAARSFERALSLRTAALGADHPLSAYVLVGIAEVALARDRVTEAIDAATQAVAIRERAQVPAAELAKARSVLAQALGRGPDQRGRARKR